MSLNFNHFRKVYIVGIKGSGVVGLAEILKNKGIEVSGSDGKEKFFTDEILKKNGIKYFENFDTDHITADVDLVIFSTAYKIENNIELQKAQELGLALMSYPEALGELFNQKYGLAVCGTHGKTTTSALLAHVLKSCDKDPSAVIGSRVLDWQGSTLSGDGDYFVIEADEYQNKFQFYQPKGIILTSLDFDHPDFFQNFGNYKKTFTDFVAKIPPTGFLVAWGDSVDTLEVAKSAKGEVIKYGFQEENDFILKKLENLGAFQIFHQEKSLGKFETALVGDHNILNAGAVIVTCFKLGIDLEKIKEAVKTFSGTSRRFEVVGGRNGALIIDDYAHHPEEIKATLSAARGKYPDKNIWAIFHPHSYSRTESLLEDFAQSFSDADKVIVLDIYGSARENSGNVHSRDLVELINKYERGKAQYLATIQEVVDFFKDKIDSSDLVLTIGAGNVFEVAQELKEK